MNTLLSSTGDGVHYLWHLEQVGCIDEDHKITKAWAKFLSQELPANAKVVIIDNGCSLSHPNLPAELGAISNSIEFAASINGTVYNDQVSGGDGDGDDTDPGNPDNPSTKNCETNAYFDGLQAFFLDLGLETKEEIDRYLGNGISNELRGTIHGYLEGRTAPNKLNIPSPSERFAAHGTACAGLIAGRPEPERSEGKSRNPSALDYFGVNPFATIIPVATVYSHSYWPLIMALLYSVAQAPDVILIPRAVEEMQDPDYYASHGGSGVGDEADPRDNGNLRNYERWAEKQLFEKILGAISERIPVVVAAGNTGGPDLEYPAKLVETAAPSLIVVGAATANGLQSTYSSGYNPDAAGEERHRVTVYAPSDDREETSADNFRIFDLAWRSRRLGLDRFEGADSEQEAFRRYAPYGVLTLDIAGQYGYDSSSEADLDFREDRTDPELKKELEYPETLPRALYTLFGGTSAASAIVTGLISLLKATDKGKELSGAGTKTLLEKALTQIDAVTRTDTLPDEARALATVEGGEHTHQIPGLDLARLLEELGIKRSKQTPETE